MRVPRVLAAGSLVALFLLLSPLAPFSWGVPGWTPVVEAQATCELIANGSFSSPTIPNGWSDNLAPTGWSGSVTLISSGGDQYVDAILETLGQEFSTAGLDGQTLTASFDLQSFGDPTMVTLGERSEAFDTDGAILRLSLTYTLPTPAPATTTLSFGISIPDLDDVSVSVPDCTPNLAPVVDPNPVGVTTTEDTAAPVMIAATDPDGDSLTYTATDPARGSVTGTGSGFTYTPDLDLFGTDAFDVTVSDGTLSTVVTVNVTITAVNDPPGIVGGATTLSYTVNERRSGGGTLTIPLSVPLSDPDGDLLDLEITTPENEHGRLLGVLAGPNRYSTTYVPDNGYVGPDQYGVLVSDGNGGTLTLLISVTVQNTNDPPVALGETLGDSDEDVVRVIPFADLIVNDSPGRNDAAAGDVLIVSAVDQPVNGTVRLVGETVEFTPTPGYSGPASLRYTVRDRSFGTARATASFTIVDVNNPPVIDELTVPDDMTTEATGPSGAHATFTPPTATDPDADDTVTVACGPASGATFPLGETDVVCTASDGGAEDTATFTVTVEDTTAPVIDLTTVPGTPAQIGSETVRVLTLEATGRQTTVAWPTVFADDLVDGRLPVGCRIDADGDPTTQPDGDPIGAGGAAFPLGDALVTCLVSDTAGSSAMTSFLVRVEDTTAPILTVPADINTEATGPGGAVVTYTATATDLVDGAVIPVCTPPSGSVFSLGTTTVGCTATDAAGNANAAKTFTVTVGDSTGPLITWVDGPQPNGTYTQATLPAAPTCTATDTGSEVTQCRVYGYSTAPGTHTPTARARDAEGNSTVVTRTYTVTASGPTTTPRPVTATPRPTSVPPTATPTRPVRPTIAPAQPTATAIPAQPTVTPVVPPTVAPTRPPRQ